MMIGEKNMMINQNLYGKTKRKIIFLNFKNKNQKEKRIAESIRRLGIKYLMLLLLVIIRFVTIDL